MSACVGSELEAASRLPANFAGPIFGNLRNFASILLPTLYTQVALQFHDPAFKVVDMIGASVAS